MCRRDTQTLAFTIAEDRLITFCDLAFESTRLKPSINPNDARKLDPLDKFYAFSQLWVHELSVSLLFRIKERLTQIKGTLHRKLEHPGRWSPSYRSASAPGERGSRAEARRLDRRGCENLWHRPNALPCEIQERRYGAITQCRPIWLVRPCHVSHLWRCLKVCPGANVSQVSAEIRLGDRTSIGSFVPVHRSQEIGIGSLGSLSREVEGISRSHGCNDN